MPAGHMPLMLARAAINVSVGCGIFLAFGWPLVVGDDAASPTFHVAAVATLCVFLASLLAVLVARR